MVSYTAFSQSCGHYRWKKSYPNGLADLKEVVNRIRAAGIEPALHIHYNKVSTNDPYVVELADPRMATEHEIVLASVRRWEDVKLGRHLSAAQRDMLKDPDREWFLWPVGFDPARPEIIEWHKVTKDTDRPVRAFSYRRGGRSGVAYWYVNAKHTREIPLPGVKTVRYAEGGIRFLEAAMDEKDLVAAFLAAIASEDCESCEGWEG